MTRKRQPSKSTKRSRPRANAGKPHAHAEPRQRTQLRVRRHRQGDCWELVHPRGVLERADDLEEVRRMIDAGETEVAADELRWLLSECRDFLEVHRLLAELAFAAGDVPLARAHFGFAYDLGLWALPPAGLDGPLPYRLPANQAFLESAKGLAHCLRELGQTDRALQVVDTLLECDPSDPLGVRPWREACKR